MPFPSCSISSAVLSSMLSILKWWGTDPRRDSKPSSQAQTSNSLDLDPVNSHKRPEATTTFLLYVQSIEIFVCTINRNICTINRNMKPLTYHSVQGSAVDQRLACLSGGDCYFPPLRWIWRNIGQGSHVYPAYILCQESKDNQCDIDYITRQLPIGL